MIINYLRTTLRFLRKNKLYTIINVTGLTLGITVFTIISLLVLEESSFDQFHSKAENIYRIITDIDTPTQNFLQATTPVPLLPYIATAIPGIEDYVRIRKSDALVEIAGVRYKEKDIMVADASLFHVFDFHLLSGNPSTALALPFAVLLSEQLAEKYFGSQNPVGQKIRIYLFDGAEDGALYTVTGVVENSPEKSHLSYQMIVSFQSMENALGEVEMSSPRHWESHPVYSYILTSEAELQELESSVNQHTKHFLDQAYGDKGTSVSFKTQALTDIHLGRKLLFEKNTVADASGLKWLSVAGLLTLLLAIGNYINLSMASGIARSKEKGIRKILGGNKRDIISRQLTEAFVLTFTAGFLTWAILEISQPTLNTYFGWRMSSPYHWTSLQILSATVCFVALASGIYPASFNIRISPLNLMKGQVKSGGSGNGLKKSIVVFQFTAAFILIGLILIISSQLVYMQHYHTGFREDGVVVINVNGDSDIINGYQPFKEELKLRPEINGLARSNNSLAGGLETQVVQIKIDGVFADYSVNTLEADMDFLSVMNIHLLAGSNFSPNISPEKPSVIINRSAAKLFSANASDVIGRQIFVGGIQRRVIAVVEDFHFNSLHHQIEPLLIFPVGERFSKITASISTDHMPQSIAALDEAWKEHFPKSTMDMYFLDEKLGEQYASEERFSRVFSLLTAAAMVIGGIGLFGFSAFVLQQRTKEMGVRKVLGASYANLLALLGRYFLKLVVLAASVALPVVWILMDKWLENFAYHIEIRWWHLLLTALAGFSMAFLSVAFHVVQAVTINPVDVLRNE